MYVPPCHTKGEDCKLRRPGCHSTCPAYAHFKAEIEALRPKPDLALEHALKTSEKIKRKHRS